MCIRSLLTLLRTSGLSCCLWVSFSHILGHFRHEFCWAHSAIYWGAFDINSYLRLAEQLDRIGLVDPADDLEAAQAQIQISYYICICICLYVYRVAEKQTQQVGGGGNRDLRRQKQQDAKQNKKEKKTEKPPIAATSKAQILKSQRLKSSSKYARALTF